MGAGLDEFGAAHAPCYVYDRCAIEARCRQLCAALPQVEFLYSPKANPFAPVVRTVVEQGFGIDASSPGEVALAEECGVSPNRVLYSAPGKTQRDIESALGRCVIVADSLGELERLDQAAGSRGVVLEMGVRLNPNFGMGAGGPVPTKFGIDEDDFFAAATRIARLSHLRVVGLQVHLRSQVLDARVLAAYYERCWALASRFAAAPCVARFDFVSFGSGIGTVYDATREHPVDLGILSDLFARIGDANARGPRVRLCVETGRFVVCDAGTYFMRVVDVKRSRGTTYLVVESAMNGFLRPAVAALLERNVEGEVPAQEPLYTCARECSLRLVRTGAPGTCGGAADSVEAQAEWPPAPATEVVDVVGGLCTALDVIAHDVELPRAHPGDVIAVSNAGAYAYTLSPQLFASHEPPGQYLWENEQGT